MRPVVNSREMKQCDGNTIQHFGVPSLVLMERAALAVVSHILKKVPKGGSALILCGNGNNGADGLAIARLLHQQGIRVSVVQTTDNGKRSQENKMQCQILHTYGIPVGSQFPVEEPGPLSAGNSKTYDCIVDALFGVGLSRPLQGADAQWIAAANRMDGYKVAVDMPSGVSSDSGKAYEPCFAADLTVTFAYQKIGQLLYPGCAKCGVVKTALIGITDESWLESRPSCYLTEPSDLKKLPKRPSYSNKGTFGKVLVVAGSKGMAGAALFCAQAAYRSGCGLVKVCTPEENRAPLQTLLPEAILLTLSEQEWKPEPILEALAWADAVVLGPGIGTGEQACRLVELVLCHASAPVVIDADGLNVLSMQKDLLQRVPAGCVITPHLGEMARLTAKAVPQIQEELLPAAREFATRHKLVCVLKDARTVTALPDGTAYINTAGCSAMAKGGSGDVLAGILAGLVAQGMPVQEAAPLGVYVHGLAGEAAAAKTGAYSVLARDLADALGCVLNEPAKVAGAASE